jgi:GT2 family glycosyltransferase
MSEAFESYSQTAPEHLKGGSKFHLIQSGANRGYAAGNNVGIRVALSDEADFVLILNNDTIVPDDFLSKMVNFTQSQVNAGIVGPKVLERNGLVGPSCARRRLRFWDNLFVFGVPGRVFQNNYFRKTYFYHDVYAYEHPKEVDLVSGCCMLIKSEVFKKTGLLDETTFLMCEEHILAERLRETDLLTYIYPDAHIKHLHGQSRKLSSLRWMRKVSHESLYYYLTHYRGYSSLLAKMAVLLRWKPIK